MERALKLSIDLGNTGGNGNPHLSVDSFDNNRLPSWAFSNLEDSDDRKSKRRSVECTAIDIRIIGTEVVQNHVSYLIQIYSGVKKWVVKRRFRDFDYLDQILHKNFPKIDLPNLPPKKFLKSSTDPEVIDERKNLLEAYLCALVPISQLWTKNDLVLFLDNETNSLMFIWNFERMRKMQDMVSKIATNNKAEPDISLAQSQVKILQDRLRQMEMIFLQQAAGVATGKLPSSVIRSLSKSYIGEGSFDNALSSKLASELTDEHLALYEIEETSMSPSDAQLSEYEISKVQLSNQPTYASESSSENSNTITKTLESLNEHPAVPQTLEHEVREVMELSNELLEEKCDIEDMIFKTPNVTPRQSGNESTNQIHQTSPIAGKKLSNSPSKSLLTSLDTLYPVKSDSSVVAFLTTSNILEGWASDLCRSIDVVVKSLSPTPQSIRNRIQIFQYVRRIIASALYVQLYPIGSLVTNTFLPDGDIDTTAFCLKNVDDAWFVGVNEALCMTTLDPFFHHRTSNHTQNRNNHNSIEDDVLNEFDYVGYENCAETNENLLSITVTNVAFVYSGIKLIKSTINDISVDISANQLYALYAQEMIEKIDEWVEKDHLFKRSLLLVKAWTRYEGPQILSDEFLNINNQCANQRLNDLNVAYINSNIYGSMVGVGKDGRIPSWALTIMLIWVFNSQGQNILHPLQALGYFLHFYSQFDWDLQAITVFGPADIDSLVSSTPTSAEDSKDQALTTVDEEKQSESGSEHPPFTSITAATAATDSTSSKSHGVHFFPDDLLLQYSVKYEATKKMSLSSMNDFNHCKFQNVQTDSLSQPPPPSPSQHSQSAQLGIAASLINAPYSVSFVTRTAFPDHASDDKFVPSFFNIVDPILNRFNVGVRVDELGVLSILTTLRTGYSKFKEMCDESANAESNQVNRSNILMQKTIEKLSDWGLLNNASELIHSPSSKEDGLVQNPSNSAPTPTYDMFHCQWDDLQFSVEFAEFLLGSKVHQNMFMKIVSQILHKKGAMPVGEIGKNLQLLMSCDTVSKRLKDQFGGLKKAIESSPNSMVTIGTDHPFNPTVSLLPSSGTALEELSLNESKANAWRHPIIPSFAHDAFIYAPLYVLNCRDPVVTKSVSPRANKKSSKMYNLNNSITPPGSLILDNNNFGAWYGPDFAADGRKVSGGVAYNNGRYSPRNAAKISPKSGGQNYASSPLRHNRYGGAAVNPQQYYLQPVIGNQYAVSHPGMVDVNALTGFQYAIHPNAGQVPIQTQNMQYRVGATDLKIPNSPSNTSRNKPDGGMPTVTSEMAGDDLSRNTSSHSYSGSSVDENAVPADVGGLRINPPAASSMPIPIPTQNMSMSPQQLHQLNPAGSYYQVPSPQQMHYMQIQQQYLQQQYHQQQMYFRMQQQQGMVGPNVKVGNVANGQLSNSFPTMDNMIPLNQYMQPMQYMYPMDQSMLQPAPILQPPASPVLPHHNSPQSQPKK